MSNEDPIRQQIENIIAKFEDKEGLQGFVNIAHYISAFVLECVADGLTREEAVSLGSSWLTAMAYKEK